MKNKEFCTVRTFKRFIIVHFFFFIIFETLNYLPIIYLNVYFCITSVIKSKTNI